MLLAHKSPMADPDLAALLAHIENDALRYVKSSAAVDELRKWTARMAAHDAEALSFTSLQTALTATTIVILTEIRVDVFVSRNAETPSRLEYRSSGGVLLLLSLKQTLRAFLTQTFGKCGADAAKEDKKMWDDAFRCWEDEARQGSQKLLEEQTRNRSIGT